MTCHWQYLADLHYDRYNLHDGLHELLRYCVSYHASTEHALAVDFLGHFSDSGQLSYTVPDMM